MMDKEFKFIFGPVLSRRLGVSLGVDLVPYKTCTLDCVYCECGATTELVDEIAEYVKTDEVIRELEEYLKSSPELDCITFSGAGEPTLHSGIGEIIRFIKNNFSRYRVAVITNGTLLNRENVRQALLDADIVMTSFDAFDDELFQKINRPHAKISLNEIKNGLIEFKKSFKGNLWLEIFVIPDINDTIIHLDILRDFISLIKPERVQLNSLDRPGTEAWVKQVDAERLASISSYLKNSEIIKHHGMYERKSTAVRGGLEELTLRVISRRPSTVEDISMITGGSIAQVQELMTKLVSMGLVKTVNMARGIFYSAL